MGAQPNERGAFRVAEVPPIPLEPLSPGGDEAGREQSPGCARRFQEIF